MTALLLASPALPGSVHSPQAPLHQARPLASSLLVFPPKKSSRTKPTTFPVLLKDHLPHSVTPHLLQKVQINPHVSRGPRNRTACAESPQGEPRAAESAQGPLSLRTWPARSCPKLHREGHQNNKHSSVVCTGPAPPSSSWRRPGPTLLTNSSAHLTFSTQTGHNQVYIDHHSRNLALGIVDGSHPRGRGRGGLRHLPFQAAL